MGRGLGQVQIGTNVFLVKPENEKCYLSYAASSVWKNEKCALTKTYFVNLTSVNTLVNFAFTKCSHKSDRVFLAVLKKRENHCHINQNHLK